ncbi:MAG: hypothetical protein QXD04_03335 [Candidatus Bathyarchaeia archaeon]
MSSQSSLLEYRRASEAAGGSGGAPSNPRLVTDLPRCPYASDRDQCLIAREKGFWFGCTGFWPYGCEVYLKRRKEELGGAIR